MNKCKSGEVSVHTKLGVFLGVSISIEQIIFLLYQFIALQY